MAEWGGLKSGAVPSYSWACLFSIKEHAHEYEGTAPRQVERGHESRRKASSTLPPPMLPQLAAIFTNVILPILVMIGLGVLLQRASALHLPTLTRLNIYLLVPSFLFLNVYESSLTWRQIGGIAAAVAIPMLVIGLPLFAALRRRGTAPATISAVIIGGIVFNAGNYGIPVAFLHYGEPGVAVQALIVAVSNLSIWYIGYVIISLGKGDGARGAMGYFKLPMIYVLVAAFVFRDTHTQLPAWLLYSIRPLGLAVVPIGLVTLGAQLGTRVRWPRWRIVSTVMFLKLLLFPLIAGLAVWGLGLWPWPGKQIIIGCAAPTAVNTLLLTLELDGDAETAADCVFWTTLVSAATVTLAMWIVDTLSPGVPGITGAPA